MQLYSYHRSSASYRVRIALNLKGLPYTSLPVHLVRNGGEQHGDAFQAINPHGLVPVLVDTDGSEPITQSLAILEYLEAVHPTPPLLPADERARARVRAFALSIACDIHPLNNLRVLQYLTGTLGITEEQKTAWYRHWVETGLAALEADLAADLAANLVGSDANHRFCFGDTPGLADCCLVPQMYNARRFDCRMELLPTLVRIEQNCVALDAFQAASPERQGDAG